ncbi:MAG TPA: DUF4251 domain-containing protein [Chitinophagaceae bacterium]
MKPFTVLSSVLCALLLTACSRMPLPQDNTTLNAAVTGKQYVFHATTANPAGGSPVRLSTGYDLVVSGDTVTATLPYYGRAYSADPDTGPIRFTTTNTRYTSTADDNGWDIVIAPADVEGIQELRLALSGSGYGTLYVTSTNRQAISFYGNATAKEAGR